MAVTLNPTTQAPGLTIDKTTQLIAATVEQENKHGQA